MSGQESKFKDQKTYNLGQMQHCQSLNARLFSSPKFLLNMESSELLIFIANTFLLISVTSVDGMKGNHVQMTVTDEIVDDALPRIDDFPNETDGDENEAMIEMLSKPNSRKSFFALDRKHDKQHPVKSDVFSGASCSVCLPHLASAYCQDIRRKDVSSRKNFYTLAPTSTIPFAMLNQTLQNTLNFFQFDDFQAHFFNVYFKGVVGTIRQLIPVALKTFSRQDFTSFKQYLSVRNFFQNKLKMNEHSPLAKYIRIPNVDYKYFTDVAENGRFLSDRYFVEARLAGLNPMAIKRVTLRGKIGSSWRSLKKKLNHKFNWVRAVKKLTGKSLRKSIADKQVYVVDYPHLDGIPSVPDFLAKTKPTGKMIDGTSPIAIFASVYNRQTRSYKLKAVAIQVDSKKSAKVVTPNDGHAWNVAKIILNSADVMSGTIFEHNLHTHTRMEPVCVSMERHLSKLHPLHQILKFHCRGTIPVNVNGRESLLGTNRTIRQLFAIGNLGSIEMQKRGFVKMRWDDIGLRRNIKQRGMEDKKKVPFYPYRDDGAIWDRALYTFAKKLVSLFYENNDDVTDDYELQNFINELSVNGKKPPSNGLGMVKGLPGKFTCKREVVGFIKAILWINVQHSAVNSPNADHLPVMPAYPAKLYVDRRDEAMKNIAFMLPGATAACLQIGSSYSLATLYYDAMFDYSSKITDKELRDLVRDTYNELLNNVKPKLDARNARRFRLKHLTYPYMVPGWVANSIST